MYKELRCKNCNRKLAVYKNDIDIIIKCKCKKYNQLSIRDNETIVKDCKIKEISK